MSRFNWKIITALGIIYIVWGSTFFAIRIAVVTIPPFLLAAMRFLTAGALLYGVALSQTRQRPSLREWGSASLIGFLLLVSGNGLVVWAEQRIPSGTAALVICTVPIWMVVLSWWTTKGETLSWRVMAGLLMGLGGVYLLKPQGPGGGWGADTMAYVALLVAALSWSIGTVYARQARLTDHSSLSAGMEMLSGGLVLLIGSGLSGEWRHFTFQQVSGPAWGCMAYLVLCGSVIAFSAYRWLAKQIPMSLLSTYAYVNPVVAVILGSFFLGEPLTAPLVGAAGIILAGVALMSWR